MMDHIRINDKVRLKIKRLGINGEGIAYYHKRLIFVEGALPGEEVLVKISENALKFSRGQLIKNLKISDKRVQPSCPIYSECGGCQIMHLNYPDQLSFKEDLLRQALEKFKPQEYKTYDIRPILGADHPWHYRNKLQFQTRRIKGRTVAGLYGPNSHHLVPVKKCLVQEKWSQALINQICKAIDQYQLPVEDERKRRGIKTVMIRRAQASREVQIIFIVSESVDLKDLAEDLCQKFPEISTIALNFNLKKTSEVYGPKTKILWGRDRIRERVLDYEFGLSPRAFYQLNSRQTNQLYAEAIKALEPEPEDHVIDAYCGVGTLGLAVADQVASVRGMDIVPEAIADARENAVELGFAKIDYQVGRAEELIPQWYLEGYRASGMIVDPPRTGLDDKLLETINRFPPDKLVYVSCNVSSLARDLVVLSEKYRVDYIQSIDMFPHTSRTEAVVRLRRQ